MRRFLRGSAISSRTVITPGVFASRASLAIICEKSISRRGGGLPWIVGTNEVFDHQTRGPKAVPACPVRAQCLEGPVAADRKRGSLNGPARRSSNPKYLGRLAAHYCR
jgi:hypothetical protein